MKIPVYGLGHLRRALVPARAVVGRFLRRLRFLTTVVERGPGPGRWWNLRTRKPRRPRDRQLSVPRDQGPSALDREGSGGARSLPADPSLPQLEVAGDPEQMREVFQRHLRPLGGDDYRVRECRILQTRYRQAVRCVVHYALRLEESGTGREREQRVSGVMYADGRIRKSWKKLRRSSQGEVSGVSVAFEPFSYVPELEMLVQVFPYDYRLPGLPLLMEGPPPELEPLLLARFGSGDWRIEAWDVKLMRYQVESRATLRLTVRARDAATDRAEEKRFYAKIFGQEGKGEQTYEVIQALWDKASTEGGRFTVGRPIAYLSDLRALVQEEAPGPTLRDMFIRKDDPTPALRGAARALAALHLDRLPTSRRRDLQDYATYLEERGRLLRRACPHRGPEIQGFINAVVAGLEGGPTAPTHGDLGLDHILVDGDRLALLDLDAFAEADPMLDVANVLSQFAIMPLVRSFASHDRAQAAARTFAEEYFAHVPEAWRARLPYRYAGAVLKRAAGLYKSQVPDWPDKIELLLGEVEDSLAGKKVW